MKVLMENFAENIRDQIPENFQGESYRYIQEKQEKEEDDLKNAVIKKQKGQSHERRRCASRFSSRNARH